MISANERAGRAGWTNDRSACLARFPALVAAPLLGLIDDFFISSGCGREAQRRPGHSGRAGRKKDHRRSGCSIYICLCTLSKEVCSQKSKNQAAIVLAQSAAVEEILV